MKYIIIPLFRIVTLPIVVLIMFGICFYYFMDIVWTFNSQKAFNYFWSDDRLVFYKSRLYERTSGRHGYCYKTFWHYIINKKTYGNG